MGGLYLDVGGSQALEFFIPELHAAFGGSTPLRLYRTRLIRRLDHPWAQDSLRLLVLRDESGNYLSHLHLCAVRALHFDREIWVGGIDALVTPVKLRRQGYATQLVRLAIDLLVREGIEGAFLFSDGGAELFENAGFKGIPASRVDLPIDALPRVARGGIALRGIRSPDWPAIGAIYEQSGRSQPLWFLRDRARWDFLVSQWNGAEDDDSRIGVVAEVGQRVVGYILARVRDDRVRLLEYGMEEPNRHLLADFLAAVRGEGERRGCVRFLSPHPPAPFGAQIDSILARGTAGPERLLIASLDPGFEIESAVSGMQGFWDFERG